MVSKRLIPYSDGVSLRRLVVQLAMCGWTVQTEGMWTLVWVLPTPRSIFGMSEWCNNCLIQFTNCESQRVSFKFQSGGWDAHVIEDRRPTSQIGWGCNCKSHCGEDITWEYKVCGPYVVTLSSWVPIFERCLMQCLPRACRWYSSRQIWTTQEALREAPSWGPWYHWYPLWAHLAEQFCWHMHLEVERKGGTLGSH